MKIEHINPFVRTALIMHSFDNGQFRIAYDYRIFYILNISSELIVADKTYNVSPGDLIFIPPETPFHFVKDVHHLVINFDISRNAENKRKPIGIFQKDFNPRLIFDSERCDELNHPLVLHGKTRFEDKIMQFIEIYNSTNELRDALSSTMLKEILLLMLRAKQDKPTPEHQLCEKIQSYIKLHAAEITSNAMLGEQFGYHPVYLGELFKRHVKKTLHEEILAQRINVVKHYLLESNMSIEEIALATNFSSRAHLCAVFKKHTNLSPTAYRNLHFE